MFRTLLKILLFALIILIIINIIKAYANSTLDIKADSKTATISITSHEALRYQHTEHNNHLLLWLESPIEDAPKQVKHTLISYLSHYELGQDGRFIDLQLLSHVKAELSQPTPHQITISLTRPQTAFLQQEDQEKPIDKTILKQTQEKVTPPQNTLTPKLRVGEHKDYYRLVLEWPEVVKYQFSQQGDKATLRLSGNHLAVDEKQFNKIFPKTLGAATIESQADHVNVLFNLKKPYLISPLNLDKRIVLDFSKKKLLTQANPKAEPKAEAKPEPKIEPKAEIKTEAKTKPSAPASTPNATPSPISLSLGRLSYAAAADTQRLSLSIQEKPKDEAYAVFQNGMFVWFIFPDTVMPETDTSTAFLTQLFEAHKSIITEPPLLVKEENNQAFALILPLKPNVNWQMISHSTETAYQLTIEEPSNTTTPITKQIPFVEVNQQGALPRVEIVFNNLTASYHFVDPFLGTPISVYPTNQDNYGNTNLQEQPEFTLLASAQGIAVRLNNPELTLQFASTGVIIPLSYNMRANEAPQLAKVEEAEKVAEVKEDIKEDIATAEEIASAEETTPPEETATTPPVTPQPALISTTSLSFEPQVWRKPGMGYIEAHDSLQHQLTQALSNVDKEAIYQARLNFARFYFGYTMPSNTLAMLQRLADEVPDLAQKDEVLFLKGLSYFMLGNYEEARAIFTLLPPVHNIKESIWYLALLAGEGKWDDANAFFAHPFTEDMFPEDPYFKAHTLLLTIEAAIMLNLTETTETLFSWLPQTMVAPQREQTQYLKANYYWAQGDTKNAKKMWTKLEGSKNAAIRAKASLARIEADYLDQNITLEQAVEQLESLRFSQRGTPFEFEVLTRLGELYFESNETIKGLQNLRTAITYFPEHPGRNELATIMQNKFVNYFLKTPESSPPNTPSQVKSPITSIALFTEFRELTPEGTIGNQIITNLVDDLIKVDLLDHAIDLMRYQIEQRLSDGLEKTTAETKLAVLLLANNKPKESLSFLKEPTLNTSLPPELTNDRTLLKAQALSLTGEKEAALETISNNVSEPALNLKAEILWALKRYQEVADVMNVLVDGAGFGATPLDEHKAYYVLNWAMALAMTSNQAELELLRADYLETMQKTSFGTTFEIITQNRAADTYQQQELKDQVEKLMSAQLFGQFMTQYRKRWLSGAGGASAPQEPGGGTDVPQEPGTGNQEPGR